MIGKIISLTGLVENSERKRERERERERERRKLGSQIISDTALVPCGSVRFYLSIYLYKRTLRRWMNGGEG